MLRYSFQKIPSEIVSEMGWYFWLTSVDFTPRILGSQKKRKEFLEQVLKKTCD